jgi:hypothetical protein
MCSLAVAAELLGMSRPSVVRRREALGGAKNERNKWIFSLHKVRRERARILAKLNAVEPDAHMAEIERLRRRVELLRAARELSQELARIDSELINTYVTPASPDELAGDST